MPDPNMDLADLFLAYSNADKALFAAIQNAGNIRDNEALASDVRMRAIGLVSDLGEERRQLTAAREAFKAKFTAVNPPSDDVIAEGIKLNKALAELVAQDLLAVGKVKAVIGAVNAIAALATQPAVAVGLADASAVDLAAVRLATSETVWYEALSAAMLKAKRPAKPPK